ncbi:MAG TPA: alpha/beta hydrolase [Thermomicrobiales bacterium]|nr:alpha/beta hydrolase [Thermomicrobiales bacterium]
MSFGSVSTRRDVIVPGEVPIHATVHPGSGPGLVLVHGISGSGDAWLPVTGALGEHFTPVTYDMRGHGESGKPESGYLYDDYIDDLDRLLAFLGLDRPLIMGHSLGGLVTLWWAARHPSRAAALVIEDSPLRSGEEFRPAFDNWIRLNGLPQDELRDHYSSSHPNWKPEVVDRRTHQMHVTAPGVFTELKDDSMAHDGVDRIAEIEHIESPTLLVHGDVDTGGMVHADDARSFGRRITNASVVRLPGANHHLHMDRMREFLAVAVPFLHEHGSDASHVRVADAR